MPRYVAFNPDGNSVFNSRNESDIFPSVASCMKGILEELDEEVAEGADGRPYTRAEEAEWKIQDYSIFKELP